MAYLHEKALAKAVARLHILGSQDPGSHHRPNPAAAGGGFGIGLRQAFKHPTPKQAAQALPAENAAQYGRFLEGTGATMGMAQEGLPGSVSGPEGVNATGNDSQYNRYLQGSGAQLGTVQSGLGLEEPPMSPQDFLKLNNQASKLRFGGRFTNAGMDHAAREADANSNDRLYLKGLMHGAIDGQGPQEEEMTAPGMAGSQPGAF